MIIAMGIGAAAFDISLSPRPGAWYPIFLGIVSLCLGLAHAKDSNNQCARIAFIIVGVFAVIVTVIGGLVDGGLSSFANSADVCFPYSGESSSDFRDTCCQYTQSLLEPNLYGNNDWDATFSTLGSTCPAADSSSDSCLCCTYDNKPSKTKGFEWHVKGDCSLIKGRLRRDLSASFIANFIAAILLAVSLSISCCRCCGPRQIAEDNVVVTAVVIQANPVHNHAVIATPVIN